MAQAQIIYRCAECGREYPSLWRRRNDAYDVALGHAGNQHGKVGPAAHAAIEVIDPITELANRETDHG